MKDLLKNHARLMLVIAALGATPFLAVAPGCETSEGFGEDVQEMDENIDETL